MGCKIKVKQKEEKVLSAYLIPVRLKKKFLKIAKAKGISANSLMAQVLEQIETD